MTTASTPAMRVLMVDDDVVASSIYGETLRARGYHVEVRHNPFGTLAHVLRFRPHLLILDVRMPGLDGGELANLLRAREAGHAAPAIIFCSGESESNLQVLVQAHGAIGSVHKGVTPDAWIRQIDQFATTYLTVPRAQWGRR